ncbi:MAG: tetratricopeptide repeat protein [Methylococcaceae bacterium]
MELAFNAQYRQARNIYNRLTNDGNEARFNEELSLKQDTQMNLFEVDYLDQEPLLVIRQQLVDVFSVFQYLANQSYGKAYVPLAQMYRGGQGIEKNLDKAGYYSVLAYEWCFANQALNDPEIWTDLAWLYEHEYGVVQSDEMDEEATYQSYYEHDHKEAPFSEWYEHEYNLDYSGDNYRRSDIAMFWYRKAANRGYARAQYRMALFYQENPSENKDFEVAALWYLWAALGGHIEAQFQLGYMFYRGDFVSDFSTFWDDRCEVKGSSNQAEFWLLKAAEQGHVEAQFCLAEMISYGADEDNFEDEGHKAMLWYMKAAQQGHVKAQVEVGLNYQRESCEEGSYIKALFWFRKAADQGSADAQSSLKCLLNHLNRKYEALKKLEQSGLFKDCDAVCLEK